MPKGPRKVVLVPGKPRLAEVQTSQKAWRNRWEFAVDQSMRAFNDFEKSHTFTDAGAVHRVCYESDSATIFVSATTDELRRNPKTSLLAHTKATAAVRGVTKSYATHPNRLFISSGRRAN